jgi:glutamyl-tRNA reductase
MLNGLNLWNFPAGVLDSEDLDSRAFILRTCQRTLVLAFDGSPFKKTCPSNHLLLAGEEAYLFLLETICGLKSKLIGENEIVGQFKEAYQIYAQSTFKDTKLLRIVEKLFKDAKDIRTKYLIGISQKTYASLTRRHFIQRAKANHIVVVGSGVLAEDLINQFKKKAKVSLCARNTERVNELRTLHQLDIIPWEKRELLAAEPYIANTIGHQSILFSNHFFENWSRIHPERLFVDLGSPSVIETNLGLSSGVIRLDDIFNEGAVVEGQKQHQINLARTAMIEVTQKRMNLFQQKLLTPQIVSDVRYL